METDAKRRGGNHRPKTQSYSLYDEDIDRLSALAKLLGRCRSEAFRQCLPSSIVLRVYEQLATMADQPLTYAECIETIVREWLVDHAPQLSLRDMFSGLRSDDAETRVRAGKLLSMSVGIGLRQSGESEDDIRFTIGPDLSKLIAQAMAGDVGATSYLESILSNVPPPKPDVADHAKAKEGKVSP